MKIAIISVFLLLQGYAVLAQETPTTLNIVEHKGQLLVQHSPLNPINQVRYRQDNQIAVFQIGDQNTLNTQIQAAGSELSYNQLGSYNSIDVIATAKEINHKINQQGDYNHFESYSHNPNAQQSLELIQYGNQQNVSIFGENSLSREMKIKVEGNDKTLVIRNFN